MPLIIRPEMPQDIQPIFDLTALAFAEHPFSSKTEQFIVDQLRQRQALAISLVAEIQGIVVGHIAFSPVTISDGSSRWFGLGPVSVQPDYQRQGIGSALIREGLEQLRASAAAGCVLLGEPEFYSRFGFQANPALVLTGVPAEYFMALPFMGLPAHGEVFYHPAFTATE